MAIRPILQYPHQALKSTNAAVAPSDPAVHAVVQDMLDTLAASPGVALAAPLSALGMVLVKKAYVEGWLEREPPPAD